MQRLGQRHVKDFVRRTATDLTEVFTDTVRNHDTIVQRVTDDRHQRCDDGQVNLDVEQRQHAHGNHHVVRQCDNLPCRQSPFKAEADIDKDTHQRRNQRQSAGLRKVRAHARANELNTFHRRALAGRFVNHVNDFTAQLLAAVGIVYRRHPHHDVAAAAEVLQLRLFKARFLQRIAQLVHINRFFEGNFNHRTAGEIKTPVKPADADDSDRHNQQKT